VVASELRPPFIFALSFAFEGELRFTVLFHLIFQNLFIRGTYLLSRAVAPTLDRMGIAMQTLRDYVNDKSNAFVVESGLIVALIAFVIALRVMQFVHGS
jgi:Flp pilus assembly pilin Flp